jgi:hypothetical protein
LANAAFSPAALLTAGRQAGLSQADLAAAIGVFDQNRISLSERGLLIDRGRTGVSRRPGPEAVLAHRNRPDTLVRRSRRDRSRLGVSQFALRKAPPIPLGSGSSGD